MNISNRRAWRIATFIPVVNWCALLFVGIKYSKTHASIGAVLYSILAFALPSSFIFFWFLGTIHMAFAIKDGVFEEEENEVDKEREIGEEPPHERLNKDHRLPDSFLVAEIKGEDYPEIILPGSIERKLKIPNRGEYENLESFSPSPSSTRWGDGDFFYQMDQHAFKEHEFTEFVPFESYWPTYDQMNDKQRDWYFYWRTQVRSGSYPDTSLSYIFVHIYELISGVGWQDPEDGYQQIMDLWIHYCEPYPRLGYYLSAWTFDFAQAYGLDFKLPVNNNMFSYAPSPRVDLLVEQYRRDIPLKLPFALVDALCDYSLVRSKFYREGNQDLMHEAIPRVVALVDAALRNTEGHGILTLYGPKTAVNLSYFSFTSALCPLADQRVTVNVKPYSSHPGLRQYIHELVRYGENVLRSLKGSRGRLRGIVLDEQLAALVDSFLKREYGDTGIPTSTVTKNTPIELDFQKIKTLRDESNMVREALKVEQNKDQVEDPELLTELKEVLSLFLSLSPGARNLLSRLKDSNWEGQALSGDEVMLTEINRLSSHYLGCNLLLHEKTDIIVEDDFRDELEYLFTNPPDISDEDEELPTFCLATLPPNLKDFFEHLVPKHIQTMRLLLTSAHPYNDLECIAEHFLTMPQMIIDEINDVALEYLGDLIIDATDNEPKIIDEYRVELKQALM